MKRKNSPQENDVLGSSASGAESAFPASPETGREVLKELDKLVLRLENSGLREYIKLSQRTGKIMALNFASGVARGLGFTIGTTIVLGVGYKILSQLISMNIPYITSLLQELILFIKDVQ